jgi:hypothetical protein
MEGVEQGLSDTHTTSFRLRPPLDRLASIHRFAATQPARLRVRPAAHVTPSYHTLYCPEKKLALAENRCARTVLGPTASLDNTCLPVK